jgi:hypothetical protein
VLTFSEAGGVVIGHPQQMNVGYANIFATCNFMSACRRWNEKGRTWANFKAHFAAAHRQLKHYYLTFILIAPTHE